MGTEQAVAEVHHPTDPHGRHLQGPEGPDHGANFFTGAEQRKGRFLDQPQHQHQHTLQHTATDQHQRPQPVGLLLLAGTDGPGDQRGNGNTDAHLHTDDQKRQREGERLGRQRCRTQPGHKDTVDQIKTQQGHDAHGHGPGLLP